jgi:hypothetical protein
VELPNSLQSLSSILASYQNIEHMLIFNQAHEVFCTAKYVPSLGSLFDSPSVMASRDGPESCGRNADALAESLERSSMHPRHGGMAGFPSTAHRDSVIPALSLKLRLHMDVHEQGKSRSTSSKAALARNEASEVAKIRYGNSRPFTSFDLAPSLRPGKPIYLCSFHGNTPPCLAACSTLVVPA